MQENVILVTEQDQAIGVMEKLEAHQKGLLHRAFSVFILNSKGEMLLQQRALSKYHSPGLWTNTCCSHPKPGEDTIDAANRRLKEEMGIETALEHKGHILYKTDQNTPGFKNGLIEYEYDHIYFGTFDGIPQLNPAEVNAYEWLNPQVIRKKINENPEQYTHWFKIAIEQYF